MESGSDGQPTFEPPPLFPAISPDVHLGLTAGFTSLYGFLFVVVYIQLWLNLYYKHKRVSYQTVFLGLCLLWAGLRMSLFSFYFQNSVLANNLPTVFYWLLYCFPVCLQFVTLCLLVLFFAQVMFKANSKYSYQPTKYRRLLFAGVGAAVTVFISTNVACAVIVKRYQDRSVTTPAVVSIVRVVINDGLFIVGGAMLSFCIYKVSKTVSASMALEAKGVTFRQACATCVLVTLLFTSRAIYNMIAVARPFTDMLNFGYGWINVSDQADFMNLNEGFAYISFAIVLFVWEILPTFIVVIFFRVRRPSGTDQLPLSVSTGDKQENGAYYFFDDPRRYDTSTDEDVSSERSHNRNSGFDSLPINSPIQERSYNHGLPNTPPPGIFTTTGSLVHTNEPQFYDGT